MKFIRLAKEAKNKTLKKIQYPWGHNVVVKGQSMISFYQK
jgi:hypothetical protein